MILTVFLLGVGGIVYGVMVARSTNRRLRDMQREIELRDEQLLDAAVNYHYLAVRHNTLLDACKDLAEVVGNARGECT